MPLKPAPEPLLDLMQALQTAPARTLMVGDKTADVAAGKGAGALTLGVTYGYGDPEVLKAAAPDFLVDDFAAFPGIILSE